MGQWGKARTFRGERSEVTIMPHICTAAFEPAGDGSVVDDFVTVAASGDPVEAAALTAGVRLVYIGRVYAFWRRADH
jgi:hypothetical protein